MTTLTNFDFAFSTNGLPRPADPQAAAVGRERWLAALERAGDDAQRRFGAWLARDGAAGPLLAALFGNSPYLTLLAEQEPVFLVELLGRGADAAWSALERETAAWTTGAWPQAELARHLRVAKRRLALTAAVADITGAWSLEQVTGALSAFAEAAVGGALATLLRDLDERGVLTLPDRQDPQRGSGVIVLGMGKLGAHELNYSSDIDLIIFYDPERMATPDRDGLQRQMVRLARALMRLLSDRTKDGYVFRTDLRLRPDPGSTPPAMTVLAAEIYYETMGQNWERAAMIKARPVAGDRDAGQTFLASLRPYVWRKNLDFAAIQDIHSIKRQINAHRGGSSVALAGHNIKVGRGGIREIEFFAQTQQLIWGGRLPAVRVRETIGALNALAQAGKVAPAVAEELAAAYRFLRRVEHRLQMINDEQTHTLPETPAKLAALATFLGHDTPESFGEALLTTLRRVEAHYAELFEDAPALTANGAGTGGNLVFTGGEPDPDTLRTLTRLGFANAAAVDQAVRGWHHGRARAMRSARAREMLTELMPVLLRSLAATPDPDAAFLAFDRFLNGLPAGVQLFSMFYANPQLLHLVSEIFGVAPDLADHLARRPSLLERVLEVDDFFMPLPPRDRLAAELREQLSQARDPEDVLDRARRWANERKFQIGVQRLRDLVGIEEAAAWSDVAEAALGCLLPLITAEFERQHGAIEGSGMAIVAMGKLGGREMTSTSDLDLIFVYGTPEPGAQSNGRRPLAASQYFARLSQRLISAVTAPTAEGRLYEVDMRLRPSGKAGPIAVSAESFRRYQHEQAWTWEKMALTRARVIAGPPALREEITAVIRQVLTQARDPGQLVRDVAEMRQRMAGEFPAPSIWDIKHHRGGLVDIEFLAQYLQLRHAHEHPGILSQTTAEALRRIGAEGLLDAETTAILLDALDLWQTLQSRLRFVLAGPIATLGEEDAPPSLRQAVQGIRGLAFPELVALMRGTAATIRRLFARLIEEPARAVSPADAPCRVTGPQGGDNP